MNHLTVRDNRYIAARLEGKNMKQAALAAGFTEGIANNARAILEDTPEIQAGLQRAMERAGITEELIAAKLRAGLEAKRTIHASRDGQITDTKEITDFTETRQTVELVAKLRGDLKDPQVSVSFQAVLARIPPEMEAEMVMTPQDVVVEPDSTDPPTLCSGQVLDNKE